MTIYQYYQQRDKVLYFTGPNYSESDNTTITFVVGQNSIGKSRLLRSIVFDVLKKNQHNRNDFTKVIALSNTQYHKFPLYTEISEEEHNVVKYQKLTYEGVLRQASNFAVLNYRVHNNRLANILERYFDGYNRELNEFHIKRRLSKGSGLLGAFESLLLKDIGENQSYFYQVMEVLGFLRLEPKVSITFQFRHDLYSNIEELIDGLKYDALQINDSNDNKILDYLIHFARTKNKFKKVDFLALDIVEREVIKILIHLDWIRIKGIDFSKDTQSYPYYELSSGEISVLSLVISLISALEDNSLICIDEPEVNLHPEWQEKIITLIEMVSKIFRGCHYIIATHSPLVISGVQSDNSYILDLAKNETRSIREYKNKSADFQLTEVFNFPGNNNEYLLRKLLVLMTKISESSDYQLDNDEVKLLNQINYLRQRNAISENDKVVVIYNLIQQWGI